ncbi:MAG: hypothetical protein JO147_06085, partial [Actinobacteria bacterium]|nr:hypothetical protein [Actinomycetota bacterium]
IGDASGGKRIDLESGKVRIARSEPAETDDADQADTDAEVQPAEEKTRTAAQQRSAARRRAIRKQAAADRQAKAGGKQAAGATDEATDTSES